MSFPILAALLVAFGQPTSSVGSFAVSSPRTVIRAPRPVETVVPNDNRRAGGTLQRGVLHLALVARKATWRPSQQVDSTVTVMTFAEEGGAPRIPGPLLRASQGVEVRVTVRNEIPDSILVVHGLRAGTVADDTLQVAPGGTREVRFRAGAPGTYLYWGTTTHSPIHDRPWRDAQLTGAIVIDAKGTRPDPAERIFVITILDVFAGDTVRNKAKEDIWERAINGRSWPYTERLSYTVGDTVRWRWINGGYLPHPMHLHGFHFRVLAKGERNVDSTYRRGAERTAVTEFMAAGSTFRMDFVPTRAGAWLMHCHMIPHITPFPERPDSVRLHDMHDVTRHPMDAMAGLVLGITTVERRGARAPALPTPVSSQRVLVQQASVDRSEPVRRGYLVPHGAEPAVDSVDAASSPLVLTRGETVAITVVNRLREPTTVHWHGMELESVFDGVSGWSRTKSNVAPLLAPGDSFVVVFTPPRAGTFMYHTHMDEGAQLVTGLYGPLIVLERGERWDPARDFTFMFGVAVNRDSLTLAINGHREPPPRELSANTTYRLRFANIHPAGPAIVTLTTGSETDTLTWRQRAKDGADISSPAMMPARLRRFGVGETYDFEWTPTRAMDAVLSVEIEGVVRRQLFRVR